MEWVFTMNGQTYKISHLKAKHSCLLISPKPERKKVSQKSYAVFIYLCDQGFFELGTMSTLHCYRCSSTSLFWKHSLYEKKKKKKNLHSFIFPLPCWGIFSRSSHSSFSIHSHIVNSKKLLWRETKHLALLLFYHTSNYYTWMKPLNIRVR